MKAIIDCDPGVDDALAILLALTSADTEILAYIPQFGNTSVDNAYNNLLKIYGVLDRHIKENDKEVERFPALKAKRKPIVIRGADGPIDGPSHSAAYFHGKDGLGDITEKHGDSIPQPSPSSLSHLLDFADTSKPGQDHIISLLEQEEDNSVTYIALGPLTNLALALRKNDKLFKQKVGMVSIMGGNLDVPGNTSPVAEFNVWADAFAAHEVFKHSASLPIYLLPLDITTDHALPWSSYHSRVDDTLHTAHHDLPATTTTSLSEIAHLPNFTTSFLRHTRQIMESFGKDVMELHDPAAVWFAMSNTIGKPLSEGWQTEKRDFVVERYGEFTRGMCVVDRRKVHKPIGRGNLGKSNAELLQEREEKEKQDPAPVQVDHPDQANLSHEETGVNVIVGTPGSDALVEQMLRDIWGA